MTRKLAIFAYVCCVGVLGAQTDSADVRQAFYRFYMGLGEVRNGGDIEEIAGPRWKLTNDAAKTSLRHFGQYLMAEKPADVAIDRVETAGDFARLTVTFTHIETGAPGQATFSLVRPQAGDWKLVEFTPVAGIAVKLEDVPPPPKPEPEDAPEPEPEQLAQGARQHLEGYLKLLAKMANGPRSQIFDSRAMAAELGSWWVPERTRDQTRAMTQSAFFFRLFQPNSWTVTMREAAKETDERLIFDVVAQPGNAASRRLGGKNVAFSLMQGNGGWRICSFENLDSP